MVAGWYPDPTGRFDHRYHDGMAWTATVASGGVSSTDPEGAPNESSPAADTDAGPGLPGFVDRLEYARERPVPRLDGALAAAAGVLSAAGVLVVGSGRSVSTGGLIGAALVLLAGGYALAFSSLTMLRPAATVLVAAGVAVLPFAVLRGLTDDGKLAGPLALVALLAIAAYVAPGLRGRPFLLGLALLAVLLTLGWLVLQGSPTSSGVDSGFGDESTTPINAVSNPSESVAAMVLAVGAAYVACTALLDRRGYRGLGTVFAAVGIAGVVLGALGTSQNLGNVGGALLVVAAGIVLVAVGAFAHRRATLWIGVAFLVTGIVGLVAAVLNDNPSPWAIGILILVGGLVVGLAAWVVASRRPTSEAAVTEA